MTLNTNYMRIRLNHGKHAIVSDEDYELIKDFTWWADKGRTTWYAIGWINGRNVKMHRYILGVNNPKIKVDHKDGNGLNNTRENIRTASPSENSANRQTKKKYLGVYFRKSRNRWFAQCRKDGKNFEKAGCRTEDEAALEYNKMAIRLHGEFAKLNTVK